MCKFISEYDKIDVIEEFLQVLEIEGNNKHINKLQEEARKIVLEYLNEVTNTELLLSIILGLRKRARNEVAK